MRVVFQINEKVLEMVDFQESDIPKVEEYFYNPYARGNTFPRREFYSYIQEMKEFGRKEGYMKYSDFPPQMTIYLESEDFEMNNEIKIERVAQPKDKRQEAGWEAIEALIGSNYFKDFLKKKVEEDKANQES